jgi:hypothetical protein
MLRCVLGDVWLYWRDDASGGAYCAGDLYAGNPAASRVFSVKENREVMCLCIMLRGENDLFPFLRLNLRRSVKLLCIDPIVLLFSLYIAIVYGILYLFFMAFSMVWVKSVADQPVLIRVDVPAIDSFHGPHDGDVCSSLVIYDLFCNQPPLFY